jgi:two-component system sensor histidine kinase/response regulator
MEWFNFFKKSELNESIIANEVFDRNVQYISVMSIFWIPVNLFHIILFYLNLDPNKEIEYLWRMGIILSHLFLMIFFIAIGSIFNYYKRNNSFRKEVIQFLLYSVFFMAIIFGVSITVLDQLVTSAITPFLLICILIPMTVLIKPIISFPILIVAYLLFFFALSLTQNNPDILLSNRANGFTFIGIGMFLTIIMWNNSIRRFQQDRIIKQQRIDLENSNVTLLETADNLRIANQTKDKFFSIIGHDLRGPFNGVLGFSELIELEYEQGSTKNLIENLNFINASARQAYLLLENLLLWAKSQKGNLNYEPSRFEINELIRSVFDLLQAGAKTKKISLSLHSERNYFVFLDEKMIETIFRNLISNAIKYTKEGGEIQVLMSTKENLIEIIVADNGIGIQRDFLTNLFANNSIKSTKGTQGESGSGLGLILCKDFVHLNKGTISVESIPNAGSKFIVTFPYEEDMT